MSEKYFRKFPVVNYDGRRAVDVTRRAVMTDSALKNPYAFYTYQVRRGERADNVATSYYDDPYLSWLVYLANEVVDPYHEWLRGDEAQARLLVAKYGSGENALRIIDHYRCNWYESLGTKISPSRYYDLSVGEKKYWQPDYGVNETVVSYSRRQVLWRRSTNAIVRYSVDSPSGFKRGEPVSIRIAAGLEGAGQVSSVESNAVVLWHVSGYYDESQASLSSGTLSGDFSGASAAISSLETLVECIPPFERVYWSPVTAWDVESEKNAKNSRVRLLDKRYAVQTSLGLEKALS